MGLMFLEKQLKLLLAAPTGSVVANMSGITIYGVLSIDNWMLEQKAKDS